MAHTSEELEVRKIDRAEHAAGILKEARRLREEAKKVREHQRTVEANPAALAIEVPHDRNLPDRLDESAAKLEEFAAEILEESRQAGPHNAP